ncbi:MAG: DNA translocase FtsK [Thiotrichales bacterium]
MSVQLGRGAREALLIVLIAIGVFMMLALGTYSINDPGWFSTGFEKQVQNLGGVAGAWFGDILFYLFGYLAFLAPVFVIYSGWLVYRGDRDTHQLDLNTLGWRALGFLITLFSGCGLAFLHFNGVGLPQSAGGLFGEMVGGGLANTFNMVGATLLLLAAFFSGVTVFTGLSWVAVADKTGAVTLDLSAKAWNWFQMMRQRQAVEEVREQRLAALEPELKRNKERKRPRIEPPPKKVEPSARPEREKQMPLFKSPAEGPLPALELLDAPRARTGGYSASALEAISRQVELKLRDFGVDAEVESVHPGPVVTRFELMLAPGVKVSKISGLAKDLARALSVVSVRVVEVIPGRPTIGLEIPNEQREVVTLSEIVASKVYDAAHSALTLALGKNVSGDPMVADLARMPHLLVAGTTGSGKSVAVNAMLLSILFKATPNEVRLILIDPKMLELNVYEGIPHLLTPVVTDMKDAANALRWAVAEMERRYKLMSALGVRNLAGFNRKVADAKERGEAVSDPLWRPSGLVEDEAAPALEELPQIVIIVDEFADMIMMVGKKVEELIVRLAQKARAAGLHLVLATQRPSVDVITGLIKANVPSRVAFQVSSKIDSRTILDQSGAEQLLGHGDMLFMPVGTTVPTRIHGAFVGDHEVHQVVAFLREQGEPNYLLDVIADSEEIENDGNGASGGGDIESDPLYDQAVAIVTESGKASISYVQRRLKVGYNRAARMIEQMEASGVVSAVQSNGIREVLAPPPPER